MSARKKSRPPRARLTHFEIRRGGAVRLRLAIADDAISESSDELGALIRKISPAATNPPAPPTQEETEVVAEMVVTPDHDGSDEMYHAKVRESLTQLIGSLCDTSLVDVIDIAYQERERRAEGMN